MNQTFTVLIVDDEKQHRLLLTKLLQNEYRVILAKHGVQAFELAREHSPDLILLDILMPELDGFGVIRALKKNDHTRNIPVIFISALEAEADEELGLELGAVDYITKPFHPPIVRARVRNHLQAVHQRQLLEQLAMIDSLTGIPNRRRFDEAYAQEWRRCLRTEQPLSLMVIDIDHFKSYNDSYGHVAGDTILKRVARTLHLRLKRPGDFLARYGGEEFVVILPEIDAPGARTLAEQLRSEIENLQIPHANSDAGPWLTISIGGTTYSPNELDIDGECFAAADGQLYQAKSAGRNRVCWADQMAN